MQDLIEIRRRAATAIQNGDAASAVEDLTQALSDDPASLEILLDLGAALLAANRPIEALASFERAIIIRSRDATANRGLGQAHLARGDTDAALAAFRQALAILPYDTYAAHMVASLSGETVKGAAAYVANLFDDHADDFDQHLTEVLHYSIPEQIAGLLVPYAPQSMLDLGCGTGLVGAALALPVMDGVDIAPQMIRLARARNLYRHLLVGDLVATLDESPALASHYDLVTAADVFVYLGNLEQIFARTAARLAPGGLFAFSVELSESDPIRLRPSGRFAHAPTYISGLAQNFGFDILTAHDTPIRHERSAPIAGRLYLLQRL